MSSPPVDDPEALRRILSQAEALFLDFDGPICSVFAGLPASVVVDQLCVVLADGGYGDPPPDIEKSSDPFDVLKYAATLGQTEAEFVNAAFTAHEVEAITAARPTADSHQLIRSWAATGRQLAIVSNNSTVSVETYLYLHKLDRYIAHVSGRKDANPALLKPNPYLINQALSTLRLDSRLVTFIGDSISDQMASRAAGTNFIGYANKPGKEQAFREHSPLAIVSSMNLQVAP